MRLAAVVPAAAALLPQLTGGPVIELEDVVAAVRVALARLRAALEDPANGAGAGPLVVVVPGSGTGPLDPAAVTGLDGFGLTVRPARVTGGTRSVLAPVQAPNADLALRLLEDAGVDLGAVPLLVQQVDPGEPPSGCLALGAALAAETGPGAVWLVLGDGSARRSPKAPGAWDPDSVPFDEAVAEMLAATDTAGLAGLDPTRADRLMAAGRAPWQVLAGGLAAGPRPSDRGTDHAPTGELLLHEAPLGVGYFVATWSAPSRSGDG